LLALEADLLSDEEFLRIGRETLCLPEVVTRLLELGRAGEAVQDASQANSWQLLKLADLFVQYGQDAAVERMMYEKAQQEMYSSAAEWLKNHHLAKNNLAAALEMAQLIFHKRPWFAEYQKTREISMELGNWEAVRQEALTFKAGESVTLPGFGGFYVRREPESWVFKFNPGQRLRALFGWSSTYSGTHDL
jgi:hypothetical protein